MMADMNLPAQTLEALMLICFGISWPLAVWKTWRTRRTEGKSFAFLAMVFVGYLAGISSKLFRAWESGHGPEWVTVLYVLNLLFVGVEICLYLRFRPRPVTVDISNPILP
ncbi:MAG TPA: hypothetical protein PK082_02195 [Phycisphaerae bacterium]|nr:hypothetical protein [Phycisphaerae bacterium]